MKGLEIVCSGIVGLYVTLRLLGTRERGAFVLRFGALAVAAWLAEDSVIRAYGFYQYSGAAFSVFVDRVPLLVALIWPVVLDSAHELAGGSIRGVFLIVLADAALIEPIAVRAGLWSWNEPGVFGVPIIGILGWALFATAVAALPRRAVVLAPLATHAMLLVCWWGAFRWFAGEVPSAAALVAIVAGASAAIGLLMLRAPRVAMDHLLLRAPGAAFFFALLLAHPDAMLMIWAIALAAPYLVLLRYAAARDAHLAANHRADAPHADRAGVGG
jgi:hypothetical protein